MLLIYSIILYSIVDIITNQFIFKSFREAVRERFGEDGYLYKLATCPVCMSFWMAIPLSLVLPINIPILLIPFFGSGVVNLIKLFAPNQFKIN